MLSLSIPPRKLFGWLRRLQLWATGDWQFHHQNLSAHVSHLVQSFLAKHQSLWWLSSPTAQIWHSATSGFSQNLNHLWKGRDFRPLMRFRKIWWGSWWQLWRTMWGPIVPTLKGTEASLSYVHSFLYLVSSSINVSTFHSAWLDTFWTDLIVHCPYLW